MHVLDVIWADLETNTCLEMNFSSNILDECWSSGRGKVEPGIGSLCFVKFVFICFFLFLKKFFVFTVTGVCLQGSFVAVAVLTSVT